MTKYNIITTSILIVSIITLVWLCTSPKFSCIRKDEKIVNGELYDSLVAVANRPPIIRIDTIRDTIQGKPIIKWKDKLVPVYLDSLSTVYKDTLQTDHFKVLISDTLQYNRIVFRKYEYETYVDTILKYVEKEKPVFVDRPVPIPQRGLYWGPYLTGYKKGGSLGAEFFLVTKKENYLGIQGGVSAYIGSNMEYYPTVGIKFGKKF